MIRYRANITIDMTSQGFCDCLGFWGCFWLIESPFSTCIYPARLHVCLDVCDHVHPKEILLDRSESFFPSGMFKQVAVVRFGQHVFLVVLWNIDLSITAGNSIEVLFVVYGVVKDEVPFAGLLLHFQSWCLDSLYSRVLVLCL